MKLLTSKQQGMTIAELMVAVAVGLIVSAAVAGLFLQTTASNNQNNEITYLQENGRYALKIIADDLEMSNFWAGLSASNRTGITLENSSAVSSTIATGEITGNINTLCENAAATTAGENWNYLPDQPLQVVTNATETDALDAFPCIENSDNSLDFVEGRNVLMIKRTRVQEESSGQTNGRPYVRGNRTVATFHKYVNGTTDPPPTGFFDWQYLNHIYYIAQDSSCDPCVPKLVRQALKENPDPTKEPVYVTEEIAEGIEGFHIEWGLDTTGNGIVDTFTGAPTNAQLLNAIIAKIYVVARSESEVVGYNNSKTYVIGSLPEWEPGDGYYRRIFSTTVVMKNTEAILQMAAM